jgi:amino acid transporter
MVIIFGGFSSFSELTRYEVLRCIALISRQVHVFDVSAFVTTYFPIPFFAALYFGYKFCNKSRMVDYADMDFVTGSSIEVMEKASQMLQILSQLSILLTFAYSGDPYDFVAKDL